MPVAAELITKIEARGVDQYARDMGKAEQVTDRTAKNMDTAGKSASGLSTALKTVGSAAVLGGFTALAAGIGGSIKVAGDFQQSLANVGAATGATSEQMAAMRAEALKIGADTSKGASEAVEAMGELTKSGVAVQDAVGGVARTVVQMSEASGSSVANMATLMSDSLNVFGLGADQAGGVADTLVKAAGASSISIDDLAHSLSAGGLVAKNAGLNIEQFSAAIGILGNQGLKSSDAGTSLKAMIAGLTPATDKAAGVMADLGIQVFDAEGKFKAFPDILQELSEGFAGLTEEQRAQKAETLFGSDGIRAFNALVPNTAAGLKDATTQFSEFAAAMGEAPSVAEQSAKRLDTLGGQIEKLKGSLETMAIDIGTVLLPPLTQVAAFLAENIGPAFEQFKGAIKGIAPLLGPIAAALGAMAVVGGVAAAVTTLAGAFTAFSAAAAAAGGVLPAIIAILGGPLTLAIVGVGAAIALLVVAWQRDWGGIQGKTEAVVNAIRPIIDGLGARLREFGELILPELTAAWQNMSDQVGTIAAGIQSVVEPIFAAIAGFLRDHSTEITTILQGAWDIIATIITTATGVISNTIQFWLNVLQGDWGGAWQNIKNIVSITWDGIKTITETFLTTVFPTAIKLGWAAVQAVWDAAWNEIKASVDNAINGEHGVIALVKALPGAILTALTGIGTLLFDVGKDLIQGFINGVNDLWDGAINFVGDLFDGVIGAVKRKLGIESPSTVMKDAGVNFIQGFIDGTGSMAKALTDYVTGLAQTAFDTFKETLTTPGGITGAVGGALVGAAGNAIGGLLGIGGGSGGPDQVPIAQYSSDGRIGYAPGAQTLSESQVRELVNQAMAITGIQMSPSEYEGYINRLRNESGFNTGVVNLWDVNARNGTPSIGIGQTIGPTFRQNALPGYGDILNPLHNIIASLRYIRRRYPGGPPPPLPGVPYAEGGTVAPGWFSVGERGFELGHLSPSGQLSIFSNEQSRSLLKGMGGTLRGYAGGSIDNTKAELFAAAVASPGGWTPQLAAAFFEGMNQIAAGMTAETAAFEAVSEREYMRLVRLAREFSQELGNEANKSLTDFYAGLIDAAELIEELKALLGTRRGRSRGVPGNVALADYQRGPFVFNLNVDGRQFAQVVTPHISQEMNATIAGTMGGT